MTAVLRTTDLAVGDVVNVTTDDSNTHAMTVSRIYNDPSIGYANSLTVMVHIRPGGYSVALRNDNLAKYKVTRP